MDRATLKDWLVIANALDRAPAAFLVRRTLQRLETRQLDAAEAAALLRSWDRTLAVEATALDARTTARALAIARLFDR